MTKADDIHAHLLAGKTIREVEALGFNLGYIRKVSYALHRSPGVPQPRAGSEPESNADPPEPDAEDTPEPAPTPIAQAAQEDTMSAEEVQEINAKLEQLDATVKEQRHAPGLCNDSGCHPCLTSKQLWGAKVAEEVKTRFIEELTAACEWAGSTELLDAVSAVHEKWSQEGRPTDPREAERTRLIVSGVEITP